MNTWRLKDFCPLQTWVDSLKKGKCNEKLVLNIFKDLYNHVSPISYKSSQDSKEALKYIYTKSQFRGYLYLVYFVLHSF